MVTCTNITKLVLHGLLQIKQYCFIQGVLICNKAVLEPRVSPASAITYFRNHCNIRFENTSKYVDTLTLFSKNLNLRPLTPRWPLTPCLLRSHVWLYPRITVSKSYDNTSMYVDTVGLFKCIVKKKQSKISHFSFCNPTTSVFVIFCESVSLIQQLWKKSITCDQKAWVGRRYNGIFDSSEVVDMVKILLLTKYDKRPSRSLWVVIPTGK